MLLREAAPLVAVLLVGVAFGRGAARLKLPSVFGELLGGVLIGPTVLRRIAPDAFALLSNPASDRVRSIAATVACVLYLLVAGTEVRVSRLRALGKGIAWTSSFGLAIPILVGAVAALLAPQYFAGTAPLSSAALVLILGIAFAISALPVIARILEDMRLLESDVGAVVLAAAAIDDAVGWTAFAVLTPWLVPSTSFSIVAILSLIAFAVGVALTANAKAAAFMQRTRVFGTWVVAPFYFATIGMQCDFAAHFDVALVSLVLLLACVSKLSGAFVGARLAGFNPQEQRAIAFGLNARGSMAIMFASTLRAAHAIDERLFVALVAMAILTALMSGPLVKRSGYKHEPELRQS